MLAPEILSVSQLALLFVVLVQMASTPDRKSRGLTPLVLLLNGLALPVAVLLS